MRGCCVPGCKTTYKGCIILFRCPKDKELLDEWRKSFSRLTKNGKMLQHSDQVCELHFESHFIQSDYVFNINGKEVKVPRGKKILKVGAVPTIFPELPLDRFISLQNIHEIEKSTTERESNQHTLSQITENVRQHERKVYRQQQLRFAKFTEEEEQRMREESANIQLPHVICSKSFEGDVDSKTNGTLHPCTIPSVTELLSLPKYFEYTSPGYVPNQNSIITMPTPQQNQFIPADSIDIRHKLPEYIPNQKILVTVSTPQQNLPTFSVWPEEVPHNGNELVAINKEVNELVKYGLHVHLHIAKYGSNIKYTVPRYPNQSVTNPISTVHQIHSVHLHSDDNTTNHLQAVNTMPVSYQNNEELTYLQPMTVSFSDNVLFNSVLQEQDDENNDSLPQFKTQRENSEYLCIESKCKISRRYVICTHVDFLRRCYKVYSGGKDIIHDISENRINLNPAFPECLTIRWSNIPRAGYSIWSKIEISEGTRFGPYEGTIVHETDKELNCYKWELSKGKQMFRFVDAKDEFLSNWLRFVNYAQYEEDQNLVAFPNDRQIYYYAVKTIPPETELLVWYGDEYAAEIGLYDDFEH